ncbi:hypothetical protein F7R91_38545 [Streptomyces luteolifulvus]|jgi:hypothetical protein|uniref:Uncharacterized protein n=1 Tax=Streptomyces luteolifulvus TaxID=2615112 RepID=A0A643JYG7_9ACTN|nr:hypothetical protein [Streptomyces luteolifulvus]KAB1139832.1 hypothetical protein F7R91_38545 [Streptomyces luteolifulvus]
MASSERWELDPFMTAAHRIDIDDPEIEMDEAQRLLYRGEPFTGEVTEFLSGKLVSLDSYEAFPTSL